MFAYETAKTIPHIQIVIQMQHKKLAPPFSKLKAKLCSSLCSHLPENQQNGTELCVLRIFICISLG